MYTYPEGVEHPGEPMFGVRFTFVDKDLSVTSAGGMNMGTKYKWPGISDQLQVNDTDADVNMKVTVVKLTENGKE